MTYPYPPPKNIPTLVPWSHIRSFLDCLLSCKPQRREPKPRPRTCLVPNHHMLPCLCSSRAVRASGFDTRARGGALGCDVCRKGGVERLGARDKGVPVALDVGGGAQPRRRRAQRRHPHVVCRVVTGRARVLEELSANRTQRVPTAACRTAPRACAHTGTNAHRLFLLSCCLGRARLKTGEVTHSGHGRATRKGGGQCPGPG